jgi:hypothetical protein
MPGSDNIHLFESILYSKDWYPDPRTKSFHPVDLFYASKREE